MFTNIIKMFLICSTVTCASGEQAGKIDFNIETIELSNQEAKFVLSWRTEPSKCKIWINTNRLYFGFVLSDINKWIEFSIALPKKTQLESEQSKPDQNKINISEFLNSTAYSKDIEIRIQPLDVTIICKSQNPQLSIFQIILNILQKMRSSQDWHVIKVKFQEYNEIEERWTKENWSKTPKPADDIIEDTDTSEVVRKKLIQLIQNCFNTIASEDSTLTFTYRNS